jgi:hypothetical protein
MVQRRSGGGRTEKGGGGGGLGALNWQATDHYLTKRRGGWERGQKATEYLRLLYIGVNLTPTVDFFASC